jgi:hypothetical protein
MANDDGSSCVQLEASIGDSDDHLVIGAAMAHECQQRLAGNS